MSLRGSCTIHTITSYRATGLAKAQGTKTGSHSLRQAPEHSKVFTPFPALEIHDPDLFTSTVSAENPYAGTVLLLPR